jgi:hypothetical protein
VPRGIIEKEEKGGKDDRRLPRFFLAMGMVSEACGLVKGWRDGASRRSKGN